METNKQIHFLFAPHFKSYLLCELFTLFACAARPFDTAIYSHAFSQLVLQQDCHCCVLNEEKLFIIITFNSRLSVLRKI